MKKSIFSISIVNQLNHYINIIFDKLIVEYLRNKNIIPHQLIDKEDLFSIGEINTTNYKNDVKFITHYTNINFTNNIKGICTLTI